jgi:division protein CdvB (Snf7/Vps24/ESCRT-III family)
MIGDSWNGKHKGDGIFKKLVHVKPDMPLSRKVGEAQRRLDAPISQLRAIDEKLRMKEEQLFGRIVSAQRMHHDAYAQMYANELVQVRKMKGMVGGARLSMEQIQLRLNTVSELGDIVVTLSPCMSVIRELGPSISGIMPEAASSMQDLSGIMGDLISSSRMQSEEAISPQTIRNQEAQNVMDEAHSVIAQEARSVIPEVPQSLAERVPGTEEKLPRAPAGARRTPVGPVAV